MIVRLMVVDPSPVPGRAPELVYQVPEKSRECALLCSLFDKAGLEWVLVESPMRRKPKKDRNAG